MPPSGNPRVESLFDDSEQELRGSLKKIWFRGDGGFAVGQFEISETRETLAVRGPLGDLAEGQPVRLFGTFEEHPRFGPQFQVTRIEIERPEGTEAVRAYLGSGIVKGIGPALAGRILDTFGEETLEIIESDPKRLIEVSGIGAKKAEEIHEAVHAQMSLRDVLLFLHGYGLSPGLAQRILDAYGEDAPRLLKNNPYRLADELVGVGFKRADEVAAKLGIAPDCEERRQAALLFVTSRTIAREGHTALWRSRVLADASELLAQPAEALEPALDALRDTRRVVIEKRPGLPVLRDSEEELVYPLRTWISETGLADALTRLTLHAPVQIVGTVEATLAQFEKRHRVRLPEGQRRAIEVALDSSVAIVTGGPGVGKTTIVRALAEIVEEAGHVIALAAPTGRAAKRLSEATGREATTLHRLLEYNAGSRRFTRNDRNPIDAEVVVVDESSMLDVALAYELVRAIRPGTHLVFVGDVDQLPSVGPGRVLEDIIGSGLVPVARLDKVFRQRAGSAIVQCAHRIRDGLLPQEAGDASELSDFYFVETKDPRRSLDTILEIVGNRIPQRFGFDPIDDIQVLSPMYRGPLGVDSINNALGNLLVPRGKELVRGTRRFRVGTKVLQLRNDYDLDLFNGDPGRVILVEPEAMKLQVRFGARDVELTGPEIDQIVPAWGITVHRAQGSEYPAVVVALDAGHYLLLHRRLLYTAVTRAKRLLVLVGSRWALERAVGNDDDEGRVSGLRARLEARRIGTGVEPRAVLEPEIDEGLDARRRDDADGEIASLGETD
ncbi:MAG: ATP-dependent RecD-like DNA helicase [Planctomycetes bacterium]|nr:ATP-dependent RecD-like DNA helicase [Planctomycetota bacterium]MCB9919376.1 ATP-dependent RecD-like DNA helicase [Planctomycetota bacterium]